jgi:hypothetical protein
MLHTSTYLTVLLAWHRFNAAVRPVEYFITWKFANPTFSALKALAVSIVIGFVMVLPLFFEPEIESQNVVEYQPFNRTHGLLASCFTVVIRT